MEPVPHLPLLPSITYNLWLTQVWRFWSPPQYDLKTYVAWALSKFNQPYP